MGAGLFFDWLSLHLLMDVNPWGTAAILPGLLLTLQGLWLLVHPYAILYEDRLEIKQNFIYNKEFYYLDAKSIDEKKSGTLMMIYNDGEPEPLPMFGMKASHKNEFRKKLAEKIALSVSKRTF